MTRDHGSDVAAIEGVMRGAEPGFASTSGCGALLIGHVLQSACKIRLYEQRAHFRRLAAGQKDGGSVRPLADFILSCCDDLGEERIDREPVAREADRGGGNITEAHRPPAA